jgi:hypothetical protein
MGQKRKNIFPLALLLVVLVALAGCRAAAQGTASAPDNGTVAGSAPVTTQTPAPTTATIAVTATATPTSTSPTAGAVSLLVVSPALASALLKVTILNGLAISIYVTNHHTDCQLVTLERLVNGSWQPQGVCRLETATAVLEIKPGATLAQVLVPGTGQAAAGSWVAGTYRVVLSYVSDASAVTKASALVYSATFQLA